MLRLFACEEVKPIKWCVFLRVMHVMQATAQDGAVLGRPQAVALGLLTFVVALFQCLDRDERFDVVYNDRILVLKSL